MPINNVTRLWSLALAILSGCNLNSGVRLTGKLIYSGGGKEIKAVDLVSLESVPLYRSSHNVTLIERLTKVTSDLILFDECPVSGSCVIKELSISSGETKTLRTGHMPTYVAESDSVFFYEHSKYQKDNALLIAKRKDINIIHKVANAPAPKKLPNGVLLPLTTPVIQIAPNEVVFVGEDCQLWICQISQATLLPTGVKDCLPQVWRSQTQKLFCYDWNSWNLYTVDLKTKDREEIPLLKGAHGLLYIPENDILIYGKNRLSLFISETSDVFAYNFATGERVKIQSHVHINSGIWLE